MHQLCDELFYLFAEYVCPKCGHFNQSARSKRQPLLSSPSGSANVGLPASPEPLKSSPPKHPTSDLPTVDTDEPMPMVVDSELSNNSKTS